VVKSEGVGGRKMINKIFYETWKEYFEKCDNLDIGFDFMILLLLGWIFIPIFLFMSILGFIVKHIGKNIFN
jgi:hypothetical protein